MQDHDKGHGRIESRAIWVSSELVGYWSFPFVAQVARIERTVNRLDGTPMRHEVSYVVTSLSAERADAPCLLRLNREHGSIENKLHYVRDRTFDEDRSQVRKGSAAHAMASLRNTAISLIRLAAEVGTSLAAATRHLSRNVRATLRLIGL